MMKFVRLLLGMMMLAPAIAGAEPGDAATALQSGLDAYAGADFRSARRALRPLADRGSAIAETLMGVMAAKGQGSRADPATAVAWWLRAANRGYGPAQLALAKALATGRGVTQDMGAAWVWARLAVAAGNGTAVEAAALADGLQRGFSVETLAKLEAQRAAWRPWG